MTTKQFERAVNALNDGMKGEHYIAAELSNGKEQPIASDYGCTCQWDDNMVFCSNLGVTCAVFPISEVVKVVLH